MVRQSRKKNMKGGLNCADKDGKICVDEDGRSIVWDDIDENGIKTECKNFTRCYKDIEKKSSYMDNTISRENQNNMVKQDILKRGFGGRRTNRKKRQNKSKKTRKNRK